MESTIESESTLSDFFAVAIIEDVRKFRARSSASAIPPTEARSMFPLSLRGERASKCGQVAQVVERSPEKAGVGGSTPSLATTSLNDLATSILFTLRTIANKTLQQTSS